MYKKRILCAGLLTVIMFAAGGCGLKASNRKYDSAIKEYKNGEYEKAATLFLEAIEKNPDKSEFYIDYGFTLIQLGEYEEALTQLSKAILDKDIEMIRENNKKALRGCGIAYYKMQMYDEAIEEFDKALVYKEASDLNMDILSYKGSSLELNFKLNEALEVYSMMLETKQEAGLYHIRADLYRKLFYYEESLKDYNRALELNEKGFEIYFGKFAVLKELGRENEAIEALKPAAELPVVNDKDVFELAKVHFYQGEYDMAVIEFNQLMEKGFSEGSFFLGEIYMNTRKYEEAVIEYERYLEEGNAPSLTLYNQMLACYLMNGDYDKAYLSLEKAKNVNDGSLDRQIMRNEIIYLEYTGDFKGALKLMEEYLQLYEDEEAENDYIFLKTRV